jgi:hypothetical protein
MIVGDRILDSLDTRIETRRVAATTRPEMPGGRSIPPLRLPGIRRSSVPPVALWEKRLYGGPGFATVVSP